MVVTGDRVSRRLGFQVVELVGFFVVVVLVPVRPEDQPSTEVVRRAGADFDNGPESADDAEQDGHERGG